METRIDIEHSPTGGWRAWFGAAALSELFSGHLVTEPLGLRAYKFISHKTVFTGCGSFRFHKQVRLFGTAGNAELIHGTIRIGDAGSLVERNIGFIEVDVFTKCVAGKKCFIEICRIKSGIAEEGLWVNQRMCPEEILQGGDQQSGIADGFIFIGGFGFFIHRDFFMMIEEVIIIKNDMADDAEPIRNHAGFIGITEMAVNV